MQEWTMQLLQLINPLIKLVKQREELYFQVLSFVNTHITADSNDLDALTIFGRFLSQLHSKNAALKLREEELLGSVGEARRPQLGMEREPVAREMLRFSSRVLQMLEASTARARKSVFDEGGHAGRELVRFKTGLGEMLKRQQVSGREYCEYIINFTAKKFARQANKLQKYLEKIERGEDTCLRQFYSLRTHIGSDASEQKRPNQEMSIPIRKVAFQLDIKQISPEPLPDKKSLKKTLKPSTKRRQRSHQKHRQRPSPQHFEEKQQKLNKQQTANKLLKFYSLLELNKKEFLQDYVFQEAQQQQHRKELMEKLLQRNKTINSHISNYVRKSTQTLTVPLILIPPPSKSSGDQRNDSLLSNRNSLKTSFLISKRKPSYHEHSADSHRYEDQEHKDAAVVVKNINPRRRTSHSNHRDSTTRGQSKKRIFVVKPPMMFEDEVIPQAQVNQSQWLMHAPLTNRYKERRNDNIRLKKRPNPSPMQTPNLPDSFRYPL